MDLAVIFDKVNKPICQIWPNAFEGGQNRLVDVATVVNSNVNFTSSQDFTHEVFLVHKLVVSVNLGPVELKSPTAPKFFKVVVKMTQIQIQTDYSPLRKKITPNGQARTF